MKYWDIRHILPYQRNFNFINGPRSIGKTYGCQKYFLQRALEKGEEFVYIVRTKDLINNGAFEAAFRKVVQKEFPEVTLKFTLTECVHEIDGDKVEKIPIGYCIALSDYVNVKKQSYPNVRWLLFDEYMLEATDTSRYVKGWKEPDILLNIYQSIDRDEDRVVCFLLGNNTSFYNPYHMHPAFSIPNVKPGGIWYSDNVLFEWAQASEQLKGDKAATKFGKMISNTSYNKYANEGQYMDDNYSFIAPRPKSARCYYTIVYCGNTFGVWADVKQGLVYIDQKTDPSNALIYALTTDDHRENTMISRGNITLLKWLSKQYKIGNVRYVNMTVKTLADPGIKLIL